MSWARFDDQTHSHPKIRRAGKAAGCVWFQSVIYCANYLTDGFLSEDEARAFGTAAELKKLCDVGLWTAVNKGDQHDVTGRKDSGNRPLPDVTVTMPDNGYFIPDFLHYHPSRHEDRAKKNARSDAGSRGGRPKTKEANEKQLLSEREANEKQQNSLHARALPDPVPVTNPESSSNSADDEHLTDELEALHPTPEQRRTWARALAEDPERVRLCLAAARQRADDSPVGYFDTLIANGSRPDIDEPPSLEERWRSWCGTAEALDEATDERMVLDELRRKRQAGLAGALTDEQALGVWRDARASHLRDELRVRLAATKGAAA